MDSKIKSKCLESEKIVRNRDLSFHWEYQRRMWKNQRESLFAILYDEKVIDTSSNICSKGNENHKVIESQISKHNDNYEKTISCLTKREIKLSIKSNVESKSAIENETKQNNKHKYIDSPKLNLINTIYNNDTAQQDPIFTKENTDIKVALKLPLYKYLSSDLYTHITPKKSDNYFINTNKTLKNLGAEEIHILTQTSQAIVKCYVCAQDVSKGELALHLFFGPLGCNDCHIKFIDCKSFRSDLYTASNCIHNQLFWLEDPIKYLISTLNKTPTSDDKNIDHHIISLKTLEKLSPWNMAFQEYDIFKKFNSSSDKKSEFVKNKCKQEFGYVNDRKCDEILLFESYDIHQLDHDAQVVSLVDHEMFQDNFIEVLSEKISFDKPQSANFEQNKRKNVFDFDKTTKINVDSDAKKMHIKNKISCKSKVQTVEFNKINQISKKAKYLKTECYKKRKNTNIISKKRNKSIESICPNVVDDKVKVSLSNDYQIEFLDLPKDGNYLVSRTPIEECPMCYINLSLYNCKVNIKLLLYTFLCQCGLTIFYMPKTPDSIDHPVKIIEF